MPTKIMFPIDDLEYRFRHISFCIEEPKQALAKLFLGYRIFKYGVIKLPFDNELDHDCGTIYGLVIKKAEPPAGTAVTASISGIDLSVAECSIPGPRRPSDMRTNFGRAILESMAFPLDSFGTECNYLSGYHLMGEEEKIPRFERRLGQLLDIAEVVFGITNPTAKDLRKFYRE